jgi:hypothetical protein
VNRFLIFIFYFRLKCNERIAQDEELRTLRKQVKINEDYRILIAKKDEEILVRFIKFYLNSKTKKNQLCCFF